MNLKITLSSLPYHFLTLSDHDKISFFKFEINTSITSYGHCYRLSEVQVINSSFYILIYDWSCWRWFRSLRGSKDPFLWSVTSLWLFDHIRVVRVRRVIIKTACLHTTNLKETMSSKNWSCHLTVYMYVICWTKFLDSDLSTWVYIYSVFKLLKHHWAHKL